MKKEEMTIDDCHAEALAINDLLDAVIKNPVIGGCDVSYLVTRETVIRRLRLETGLML